MAEEKSPYNYGARNNISVWPWCSCRCQRVVASASPSQDWSYDVSSVQFSSVQDGISARGKAHMRFIPSLGSFPGVAFETVPNVRLIDDDGPLSSFQGRLSSASSFHVGPSLSELSGVVPSCFTLSLSTVFFFFFFSQRYRS